MLSYFQEKPSGLLNRTIAPSLTKYGYRATEDAFSVTLINTSCYPDPFPDRGMHQINIALAIGSDDAKAMTDTASHFNHPAYYLSNGSHPGTLPTEQSYLTLDAKHTVLSAVLPDGDGLTLRLRQMGGEDEAVTLRFTKTPTAVTATDLNGREVPSDAAISGNTVTLTAKAHTLTQLSIRF